METLTEVRSRAELVRDLLDLVRGNGSEAADPIREAQIAALEAVLHLAEAEEFPAADGEHLAQALGCARAAVVAAGFAVTRARVRC